jgi:GNAT superfamily N-acetyltransferase
MSTLPAIGTNPLLAQLLASDELYFRMASQIQRRADCEVVHTPGLTHVPAGCVVQSVRFEGSRKDAESWIDAIEREVTAVGSHLSRVYLTSGPSALTAALTGREYRWRQETAFCAGPRQLGLKSNVAFHRVTSEQAWAERQRMHEEDHENSDGYSVDPAAWCQLIRAKCATGTKESYLIESGGQICGSIAVIQMRNLIRFKNLLIRPTCRRKGLGIEVIHQLAALTQQRGLLALGAFGIEGEGGAELYRAAGFSVIGSQTEWCRRLATP